MSKPTYDQIFSSLVVYRLMNGEGTLPPKIQDIATPDQVAKAVREVELGLADLKAEAVLAAAERIRTYADKADGVRFTEHEVADAGGVMLLREYAKSIIDDAKGVTGTVDADLVSETLEAEAAAIQTAAEALASREPMRSATAWENLHEFERSGFRESARAALVAAQGAAPQAESEDNVTCRCGHGTGSHDFSDPQEPCREIVCDCRGWFGVSPVLPSSGIDEETLANLIHSTSVAHFGGLDPRVAPIIARAVAEFLKGEER